MSQVWTLDGLEPTERLLQMAMADHANDAGYCWPGLPLLALKTHISLRQVQRLMRRLEKKGYFSIERPGCGRGRHTRFIINRDKLFQTKDDTHVTLSLEKVTSGTQKGDIAMSQKGDMGEHKRPTTVMNHQRTTTGFLSETPKRSFRDIVTGAPPPGLS